MPIDPLHLADLGAVDVEMSNPLGVGRKPDRIACHAVVEAGAHGNEEITVLDRIIRGGEAVHAEHMQGQRMLCIACAERHERSRHRNAVL